MIKYRYLQRAFEYYSELGQLSYHRTKILTSGFYNAMECQ